MFPSCKVRAAFRILSEGGKIAIYIFHRGAAPNCMFKVYCNLGVWGCSPRKISYFEHPEITSGTFLDPKFSELTSLLEWEFKESSCMYSKAELHHVLYYSIHVHNFKGLKVGGGSICTTEGESKKFKEHAALSVLELAKKLMFVFVVYTTNTF